MAALIDISLLLGLTLRVVHLVTQDTISDRYLRQPVHYWAGDDPKREFWADGLECPWCVGFWLSGLCLASLMLAGGPGDAAIWWQVGAGWFTLSYVVARIESLFG